MNVHDRRPLNPEALLRERPKDDLARLRGRSLVFGVIGLVGMAAEIGRAHV